MYRTCQHLLLGLLLLGFAASAHAQTGTLTGLVSTTAGDSLADATVFIMPVDTTAQRPLEVRTDANGGYRAENLQPGAYLVNVYHPRIVVDMDFTVPAEIRANETTVVSFTVPVDAGGGATGTLQGTVTAHGAGVPGQEIIAFSADSVADFVEYRGLTDSNGFYQIPGIRPGTFYVQPVHPTWTVLETAVIEPNGITTVNFSMDGVLGTSTLAGVVRDAETGTPLEGITLEIFNADSTSLILWIPSYATTDADGAYEATGLFAASYHVTIAGQNGYQSTTTTVALAEHDTTTLNFALSPAATGTVGGTVTDVETGAGIPDGPMLLIPIAIDTPVFSPLRALTDADGSYTFPEVPTGIWAVQPQIPGYTTPRRVEVTVAENATVTQDFALEAYELGAVAGSVADAASGDALARVEVTMLRVDDAMADTSGFYWTLSDENGAFLFDAVLPGLYSLTLRKEGYLMAETTFEVSGGGTENFAFRLEAVTHGTITGRVSIEGTDAPLGNTPVLLMPTRGRSVTAFTNDRGVFEARVEAGAYLAQVVVIAPDSQYYYTEYYDNAATVADATTFTVRDDEIVTGIDFAVPDFTTPIEALVSGTVTDAEGMPIAGATVEMGGFFADRGTWTTRTDAEGRYTVAVTQYTQLLAAWAEADGYAREYYLETAASYLATPIPLDFANPVVTGIDFTLAVRDTPPDSTDSGISGQVFSDETGLPLANATVVGFSTETDALALALTDANGHYTLANLREASYYVLFIADEHEPEFNGDTERWWETRPIQVQGFVRGVNASLGGLNRPRGGGRHSFRGQIHLENGLPGIGALAMLHDEDGAMVAYDFADLEGEYLIEEVPEGSYTLTVSRVGFEAASEVIVLDANDQTLDSQSLLLNFDLTATTTAVDPDDPTTPEAFLLGQNYPNPFNPTTRIQYELAEDARVTLRVFDLLGREVARLVDGRQQPAGIYTVRFEASADLASGIYFYQIQAGTLQQTRKMVLMK